jgi:membrane protease YdiL (CAAX protease family)
MKSKWLAAIPPYLAVWAGLFLFNSAWGALAGFHVAILLSLLWLKPALPTNVFLKPAQWKSIFISVLLCSSGGLGLYLLWDGFGISATLGEKILALGLDDKTWLGFVAYFSLVNPFMEEYFWRGVLGSDSRSLHIGDLVYAGFHAFVLWDKAHFFSVLLALSVLVFIGWFWRQVYRRDGSLMSPVLGHMAADFSVMFAVFLKTSGQV